MSTIIRSVLAAAAMLASGVLPAAASCPPSGWTRESLAQLPGSEFAVADDAVRQALAIGLVDCLADPDPKLRDGVGFEALSAWMRADRLEVGTRRELLIRLQAMLQQADAAGFRAPFAALVLSEVARTDRIKPWLADDERKQLVLAASAFLSGVRDYRGFEDGAGWRHGVAHGADLALQLAMNPAVAAVGQRALLDAVASQVAPAGHAYVFGEPERLARPVWAMARRTELDASAFTSLIDKLAAPAPMADWREAFSSSAGLARRHDTRAFLVALRLATEDEPALAGITEQAKAALATIP